MHLRVFAIGLTMACGIGVAQAADLGALTVLSRLDEPFYAKLDVTRTTPNENVRIQFASDAVYQRAGVKRIYGAGTLSLELTNGQKAILWIRGKRAMSTENFSLIFEAISEQKSVAKHYRVRLPKSILYEGKTDNQPQAPIEHREKPLAKSSKLSLAEQFELEQKAYKQARAMQKKAFEQSIKSEAKKPAPVPVSQLKRVTPPLDASQYNVRKPLLVQPGMTGWSIGRLYRTLYPKASIEQVLVALVHANPNEFEGGLATGAIPGSWLVAPSAELVAAVNPEAARKAVHASPAVDLRSVMLLVSPQKVKKEVKAATKTAAQTVAKPAAKEVVIPKTAPAKTTQPKAEPKTVSVKTAEPKTTPTKAPIVKPNPKPVTQSSASSSQVTPLAAESPQLVGSVRRHIADPVAKKAQSFLNTGGALFWGLLSLVLALASGGLWWYVRRRAAEEDREEPVMFSQSRQSVSEEQLKNIDKAVSQRIQSDLMAQRGIPKLDESFKLDAEASSQTALSNSEPTITKLSAPELEMLEMVHAANEVAKETGDGHVEPIRIRTDSISIPEPPKETVEPKVVTPLQPEAAVQEDANRQEPRFEDSVRNAADELSKSDGEFELSADVSQTETPPKA